MSRLQPSLVPEPMRQLPLLAVNCIQFVSPTIQVILGYYYLNEPFSWDRWAAVACVWVAVIIFIADAFVVAKQKKRISELMTATS